MLSQQQARQPGQTIAHALACALMRSLRRARGGASLPRDCAMRPGSQPCLHHKAASLFLPPELILILCVCCLAGLKLSYLQRARQAVIAIYTASWMMRLYSCWHPGQALTGCAHGHTPCKAGGSPCFSCALRRPQYTSAERNFSMQYISTASCAAAWGQAVSVHRKKNCKEKCIVL